jgi:hypothetical protein
MKDFILSSHKRNVSRHFSFFHRFLYKPVDCEHKESKSRMNLLFFFFIFAYFAPSCVVFDRRSMRLSLRVVCAEFAWSSWRTMAKKPLCLFPSVDCCLDNKLDEFQPFISFSSSLTSCLTDLINFLKGFCFCFLCRFSFFLSRLVCLMTFMLVGLTRGALKVRDASQSIMEQDGRTRLPRQWKMDTNVHTNSSYYTHTYTQSVVVNTVCSVERDFVLFMIYLLCKFSVTMLA